MATSLAPELILREAVQWQAAQAGVLRAADPVLASCPAAWRSSRSASLPGPGAGGRSR